MHMKPTVLKIGVLFYFHFLAQPNVHTQGSDSSDDFFKHTVFIRFFQNEHTIMPLYDLNLPLTLLII